MFGYFWSRNATLGMAALYLVLGIVLLLFPGMSGTVFCWGLAAGAGLYAAGNFWRWHQGKKQGYSTRESKADINEFSFLCQQFWLIYNLL